MDLLQNPFYILGANLRDNKRRIRELAEEQSLLMDSGKCAQARSDLTNPRKRISAEVAWLIGIGPKRSKEIINLITTSAIDAFSIEKIPAIARTNLLASALLRLHDNMDIDGIDTGIYDMALEFEKIESEEVRLLINEERAISDFPKVNDISAIEDELSKRRVYYGQVLIETLDKLQSKDLVVIVTAVVEYATEDGEKQGLTIIDDLVDAYEVRAQYFLEQEKNNIEKLIGNIHQCLEDDLSDTIIKEKVNQLIQIVKNWDLVAQPIQVSMKSRGLRHDDSYHIASSIRSLAIELFNEHDELEFSQKLTGMLQEVFAEVIEVAESTAEDLSALDEIAEQRKLGYMTDQIFKLCKTAIETSEQNPSAADRAAQRIISAAPQLLSKLDLSSAASDMVSQCKDELALTLMNCAIVYGNDTDNWKQCVSLLSEAMIYASSEEVKSQLQTNLGTVKRNERLFGDLTPISAAPNLSTINGIGCTLYGSTDSDPATGSYLATYYFTFLFIPLFPICRYRVIPSGDGYRFLGKAALRPFDKCHIAISIGLILWILISIQ